MKRPRKYLAPLLIGLTSLSAIAVGGVMAKRDSRELASTPTDLSWANWRRALLETKKAFGDKDVGTLAASVAYGGTLAFFPLVVAMVAIAGSMMSPEQIRHVVDGMASYLPEDIASLITAQLTNAMGKHSANTIAAIVGVGLALFGVSGAMNNLINALNRIYERKENRNFLRVRATSLFLTTLMVIGMLIILPLLILGSGMLRAWHIPEVAIAVFGVVRWVILAIVMVCGLSFIYRVAPDRPNAKWQWVSWGAIIATLLWLVVTALFFIYVQNFSNFSSSYSLFAGIIVLMMWLNYSGMIILAGAEVNHQLEKRAKNSTSE